MSHPRSCCYFLGISNTLEMPVCSLRVGYLQYYAKRVWSTITRVYHCKIQYRMHCSNIVYYAIALRYQSSTLQPRCTERASLENSWLFVRAPLHLTPNHSFDHSGVSNQHVNILNVFISISLRWVIHDSQFYRFFSTLQFNL